jgi:hypothetical protein
MLTHAVTDQRAWDAGRLDDRSSWYYPLSPGCLAALEETIHNRRPSSPATSLVVADATRKACGDCLRPVLHALESGRGFAIIDGVPVDRLTTEESQMMYWLIGQVLGQPFEQNVQGTLLYDVRDYGQDVSKGARFSVTNAESTFHTDNSFGAEVGDYVGLLCLNTARSGGTNMLVSAYAAHNVLLKEHRDVLELLYSPLHVDRRGGTKPGEPPTVRFPIFAWDGAELTCRYLRYWIEVGQEKAGAPLTPQQTQALDTLDRVLQRRELWATFDLQRGQILFINNRWLFHNRTGFEDHPEPELRRHLVRLWLKRAARAH